jgi:uncharacterized protein (DUF4415 family)
MIRPVLRPEERKVPITIRLDREVVEYFRSSGRGWQTRLNEEFARIVKRRTKKEEIKL